VQLAAPEARVVKAWNSVGHSNMVDPDFPLVPTMPICGNNEEARQEVAAILVQFGWEVEDMGSIVSARAIEPLCMLWCIPGFQKGDWDHVFKVVRK
jgi:predicted dinucleotide-binding enzyme